MEELLNKLIEKGWKPFGVDRDNRKCIITYHKPIADNQYFVVSYFRDDIGRTGGRQFCKRELVSKESGLWQFVCENHLYIYKSGENKNFIQDHFKNEYNECCYQYLWDKSCYEYYLLESALCNEEALEKFLLDNIKIS